MNKLVLKYVMSTIAVVGILSLSINVYAEDRDAYQKKIEAKIEKMEKKIENLRDEAKQAKDPSLLDKWADGLNNLKEGANTQFDKLKNASADGWENLKTGVDTSISKTDEFYKNLRKEYYLWKAENRLNGLVEDKAKLEERAALIDDAKVGLVKKNFSTFSNKASDVKSELEKLKEADVSVWNSLQSDIEYSIDQLEVSYNYLARQVKLLDSNQKVDDYTDKIQELKAKTSYAAQNNSTEFRESVNSLENKLNEAKDKVEDLSASGKDKLDKLSKEIDSIFEDIERNYKQALSHIEKKV